MKAVARTTWGLSADIIRHIYERGVVALWVHRLGTKKIRAKFRRLDHLVAKMVTKAFPSASVDLVLAMAGVKPFEILAQERAVAAYLHTNLVAHLAFKPEEYRRARLPHWLDFFHGLLEEVLGDLPDHGGEFGFERKGTVQDYLHPELRRRVRVTIAGTREDPDTSEITGRGIEIFTDGSKDGEAVGASYVMYEDGVLVDSGMTRLPGYSDIFQAETEGICQAMQSMLRRGKSTGKLFSDSQSVLQATGSARPSAHAGLGVHRS